MKKIKSKVEDKQTKLINSLKEDLLEYKRHTEYWRNEVKKAEGAFILEKRILEDKLNNQYNLNAVLSNEITWFKTFVKQLTVRSEYLNQEGGASGIHGAIGGY